MTDANIFGNTIHNRVFSGGQSANYEEIIELTTPQSYRNVESVHRLKIEIKVDSYTDQNVCRVSRWDGSEWQYVASIPQREMRTEADLAYKKGFNHEDFNDDRYDLINLACLVIWGSPWQGQQ